MKIAMMVRAFLQTPVPEGIPYSPATIALQVAEGLQTKGHDVTFFGPEGSKIGTKLESCGIRARAHTQEEVDSLVGTKDMFSDYLFALDDAVLVKNMFERAKAGEFDCLIFNHFETALPFCSLYPTIPVVFILHDFIDENRRIVMERHASPNQYYISISNSQRRDAPDLPYAATIYNGVDTEFYSFGEKADNYLLFAGRVTPSKGVKEAIQVAKQANRRLLIAGSLSSSDYWYFDEHVKPHLDSQILFLGMLDKEQLVKYYQNATALLVPIQWQEPFGLTMAEANSCGTPVIAFNRGSVSEVIKDGTSGYIVNNSAEMVMAIEKIEKIDRATCRQRIEKEFTIKHMVDNYDRELHKIVEQHNTAHHKPRASSMELKDQLTYLSHNILRPITSIQQAHTKRKNQKK